MSAIITHIGEGFAAIRALVEALEGATHALEGEVQLQVEHAAVHLTRLSEGVGHARAQLSALTQSARGGLHVLEQASTENGEATSSACLELEKGQNQTDGSIGQTVACAETLDAALVHATHALEQGQARVHTAAGRLDVEASATETTLMQQRERVTTALTETRAALEAGRGAVLEVAVDTSDALGVLRARLTQDIDETFAQAAHRLHQFVSQTLPDAVGAKCREAQDTSQQALQTYVEEALARAVVLESRAQEMYRGAADYERTSLPERSREAYGRIMVPPVIECDRLVQALFKISSGCGKKMRELEKHMPFIALVFRLLKYKRGMAGPGGPVKVDAFEAALQRMDMAVTHMDMEIDHMSMFIDSMTLEIDSMQMSLMKRKPDGSWDWGADSSKALGLEIDSMQMSLMKRNPDGSWDWGDGSHKAGHEEADTP